ncbi:receptor-interacting serine/threonine-protein kinase 3 isoform X2 [Xenopus laevis]|uniref:Receptor-interacting serine/threonine-protein kinase 3 isoform X2 n=1 Tax=Xenopus laevis TaxID=8355 RepID=A0A8J1KVW1_XENLA|nr:receptor-interacting serine/threonine-protein kinase 3 isoform X2 [Xenopus laevis]
MEFLKHISEESLKDWFRIGQGGFGMIYRARHTEWNFDVAVKKLKGDVSWGLAELLSEAKKMAIASPSPYVITMYGIVKEIDKGNMCRGIVMEYMENGCLDTLISCYRPIPWALKFRIIHQVALGMNWLHSLHPPLLHLDLKAKNVLLTTEMHVKITDFGLSKFIRGTSTCGSELEYDGGTAEYMPPEAFQANYKPSTSTDIYSFAILTTVVLTEEEPYPISNSTLIRQRVCQGDRPCLLSLEKEHSVPCLTEAIEFTKCCWQHIPSKRPSFTECCNNWEKFYLAHKNKIIDSVRQVQDNMMKSTTDSPSVQNTTLTTSTDMSEAIRKFKTMHFTEEMPPAQMAQPRNNRPVMTREHQTQHQTQFQNYSHPHSSKFPTRGTATEQKCHPSFPGPVYHPRYPFYPGGYYVTPYFNPPYYNPGSF